MNNKGEVIGIVLGKSDNENLNYALPVEEVIGADDNIATYHRFVNYGLITTTKLFGPVKSTKQLDLPLSYQLLREKLTELSDKSDRELLDGLLNENKNNLFPIGEGSYRLLHKSGTFGFPYLAAENQEDGLWNLYKPNDIETGRLEGEGYISFGSLARVIMSRIRKPLDIPLTEFMEDSKLFGETFLKAYSITRIFGSREIRITSLGDASEKYTFDDKYGRKWLAQAWDIGFADSKLLIYSMPVPSGFISMAILGEIGDIDGAYRIDLEEYLNYIFFSYYGTFKEWKEYLAIDNYLSAFFKNTHFSYKSNSSVSFKNEQFSVDYNTDLYDISDISSLTLKASYVMGNNGPVWRSVGGLFTENYNSDNFFFFSRETIPEEKLTKNYKDDWDDMKNRNYPFDGSVQPEDGKTYVDELHYSYWDIQDSELDKDGLLYFIGICNEGSKDKLIMEPIMEKAQSALTILE